MGDMALPQGAAPVPMPNPAGNMNTGYRASFDVADLRADTTAVALRYLFESPLAADGPLAQRPELPPTPLASLQEPSPTPGSLPTQQLRAEPSAPHTLLEAIGAPTPQQAPTPPQQQPPSPRPAKQHPGPQQQQQQHKTRQPKAHQQQRSESGPAQGSSDLLQTLAAQATPSGGVGPPASVPRTSRSDARVPALAEPASAGAAGPPLLRVAGAPATGRLAPPATLAPVASLAPGAVLAPCASLALAASAAM